MEIISVDARLCDKIPSECNHRETQLENKQTNKQTKVKYKF